MSKSLFFPVYFNACREFSEFLFESLLVAAKNMSTILLTALSGGLARCLVREEALSFRNLFRGRGTRCSFDMMRRLT